MRNGLLAIIQEHPGFCIMFVLVLFSTRLATRASAKSITYATAIWAIIIIAVTDFPFWQPGETLSMSQLAIGSIASFVVISGLAFGFDRSFIGKSLEERRRNWG